MKLKDILNNPDYTVIVKVPENKYIRKCKGFILSVYPFYLLSLILSSLYKTFIFILVSIIILLDLLIGFIIDFISKGYLNTKITLKKASFTYWKKVKDAYSKGN